MPRVEGATEEQQEILERIFAGFPFTRIRAVRVAPEYDTEPEPDAEGNPPPSWDPTTPVGDALRLSDPEWPDLRTQWELELIGAAFHRASSDAGLTPVAGVFSNQGGPYFWADETRHQARTPNREKEEARIRAAAAASGASIERVEFLEPGGLAVATNLSVVEPHAFLRRGLATFTELSGHYDRERAGSWIEIRDGESEPVYQLGCRGAGCMSSSRRDVACCAPGSLSRALDDPGPPPCPVFSKR